MGVDKTFIEASAACIENRKSHGSYFSAMKRFKSFWDDRGGYKNVDTLDEASRELLNTSLNVRPVLEDAPGTCGAGAEAGSICTRPKQRCQTCGTILRCSRHYGSHTREECREIFWATHNASGKRVRTMAD